MTTADDPSAQTRSRLPIWRRRWVQVVAGVALALVLFLAIFDWNWLRGPVERMVSRNTGRSVTLGHLDVKLALSPRIVLTDISIDNAPWAGDEPLAHARELSFSVRLLSLLSDEIVLPHLSLTEGAATLVRDAEGRANWTFDKPDEKPSQKKVTVQTLALRDARVSYRDAKSDTAADVQGATRIEGPYESRMTFSGRWRGNPLEGTADIGNVLSLRETTEPFPLRLALRFGKTSVNAEGQVGGVKNLSQIDAKVSVSGPSLSALYPTLPLALPDTPPFRITGRLVRDDGVYTYTDFSGVIGNTDLAGDARYERRQSRPLLTATIKSRSLDLADLGPLVGLPPRPGASAAPAAPKGKPTPAKVTPAKLPAGKVFPNNDFNVEKLNAMDADVRLSAATLKIPEQIPLEDFYTHLKLNNGVLVLNPLNFGMAGGDLVSTITMDARTNPMSVKASIDLRRVRLGRLFPTVDTVKNTSTGALGAQIRLAGRGNSIADMLATANGTITAGMAGGRVSEISVWLVNLHGGKLLPLLFGGDRPTEIRCGAVAFDVKDGVGTMGVFVFDTDESRINGSGSVNLGAERFDITLEPLPKKAGILSIRGPVHIYGTFRDADFSLSAQSIGRGIGAVALGLVNPLLALLPLIESGPGQDADCKAVLAPVSGAVKQSGKQISDAPSTERETPAPIVDTRKRSDSAPIVDVPTPRSDAPAPIVDVPAKK